MVFFFSFRLAITWIETYQCDHLTACIPLPCRSPCLSPVRFRWTRSLGRYQRVAFDVWPLMFFFSISSNFIEQPNRVRRSWCVLVLWSNRYCIKFSLVFITFIRTGFCIVIWNQPIFSSWGRASSVDEWKLPTWVSHDYLCPRWSPWLTLVRKDWARIGKSVVSRTGCYSRPGGGDILVSCTGVVTRCSALHESNWYLGYRVISSGCWAWEFISPVVL